MGFTVCEITEAPVVKGLLEAKASESLDFLQPV